MARPRTQRFPLRRPMSRRPATCRSADRGGSSAAASLSGEERSLPRQPRPGLLPSAAGVTFPLAEGRSRALGSSASAARGKMTNGQYLKSSASSTASPGHDGRRAGCASSPAPGGR